MAVRIPPHNLEAEQSVLGGLMVDPLAWDQASAHITEEDFYKIAHRKIYNAITQLYAKSQPIDIITVSNFLTDSKDLDAIGGPAYLAEVMNATPTAVRTVPAIIPPGVVQAAMALATPGTQVRSRSVRSSQTVRKANRVIAMSSPKISAASCENAVHPRC